MMASAGNPNQQAPPPFDMHKLFKPSSGPLPSPPSSSNTSPFLSPLPPPPPPPPPTTTTTYSFYPPQTPPPYHLYSPLLLGEHQQQQQQQPQISNPGGARLMALLGSKQQQQQQQQQPQLSNLDMPPLPPPSPSTVSSSTSPTTSGMGMPSTTREFSIASNSNPPARFPSSVPSAAPPVNFATPLRFPMSKLPKGRHLVGDRVVYDIDVRLKSESQPQLEVTPITKYVSDPGLLVGRQIAVNTTYICYGLKMGNIRVLNINTALRSLLRGHTQRVSDMAFFAEDVHLLASASIDGRIFIWKINEGPDEEDKPQITGKIVIAIQIVGGEEAAHPRVCWHCHKQEVLVVAFGNHILKIDTIKVGKGEHISAEEPLKCPIDKLIDGVQLVGKHDDEVTELTMCQWMTTRLASASTDGMVKIWEDRKATPLAVLRPHDGDPVNSATFLTSPHRPDHIILITAGLLNREVKIWTSTSEEGWLLPGDAESWECNQTLDLRSSAEPRVEAAFFNQVVALPQAGLLLLANAKKNAIYAVHIEYGPNPAATRMDYIAEFTVTMPILSLTGTSDSLPDGEHVVQVYCVQTQAIQQYALNWSQCLPPPLEIMELERTGSSVSRASDGVNSDGSPTLELSHGSRLVEMPPSSPILRPPIISISTSSEDSPMENCTIKLSSSEVTSLPKFVSSAMESIPSGVSSSNSAENLHSASPVPLSPRVSGKSSDFRSATNSFHTSSPPNDYIDELPDVDHSVDRRVDAVEEDLSDPPSSGDNLNGENRVAQNDISMVSSSPVMFKHPTHLITPSEILSKAASSSDNSQTTPGMTLGEAKIQDVVNNDVESIEVEVKVVGETGGQINKFDCQRDYDTTVAEKKEKSFCSQASDLGIRMARDFRLVTYAMDKPLQANSATATAALVQANAGEEDVQESARDASANGGERTTSMTILQSPVPGAKGRRQKGKNSQVSGPSSPSPCPFNSTDSSIETGSSSGPSGAPSVDAALAQLGAMQEMLNQLTSFQKEMQKQMNAMVSAPVTKEGRRLEASLGRTLEKVVKANGDALWAHFQEENAKHEKLERDHTRQIANMITNFTNKDLPALLEKTLKKEIAAIGPAVARAITPVLEKTISLAIFESFQRGVGDKAINQLEKSVNTKLEATVPRQIQAQFQSSGKQALQDALRSSFEASVIPAFETSCKALFEQVDMTFQKGLVKHATASQQQFESTHSPLAVALRDAINSASSITRTLSGELADGERKLLAIAAAGANSKAVNPLVTQLSNGPLAGLHEMVEAPLDPTKELSRLLSEHKYEEAFTGALQRSDVSIVSWLCSQVDLTGILSLVPLPLSQGVLLALLQQLACDINKETSRKLAWMRDVAIAINPADPMIAMHARPIFEQVYQILGHQRNLPSTSAAEASSIRLLMHVINSVLMSCK